MILFLINKKLFVYRIVNILTPLYHTSGLMHLFKTVQEMQDQLKLVHETALELAAEKENRKSNMNVRLLIQSI